MLSARNGVETGKELAQTCSQNSIRPYRCNMGIGRAGPQLLSVAAITETGTEGAHPSRKSKARGGVVARPAVQCETVEGASLSVQGCHAVADQVGCGTGEWRTPALPQTVQCLSRINLYANMV